jgi:hypothetical protein
MRVAGLITNLAEVTRRRDLAFQGCLAEGVVEEVFYFMMDDHFNDLCEYPFAARRSIGSILVDFVDSVTQPLDGQIINIPI